MIRPLRAIGAGRARLHRPVVRRVVAGLLAAATAVTMTAASPAAAESAPVRPLPDVYRVSAEPGVLPEGIAIGVDGSMYVSSDGHGTLHHGRVTEHDLSVLATGDQLGRTTSLGVEVDRAGRIWSVGADRLTVQDRTGRLLVSRTAEGGPLGAAALNDLVLTDDAVYATDWANPVIYRAELHGNDLGPLEPWLDIRPAWPGFPAQYWLLNGIVAGPGGDVLLVASNGTEAVWRVETSSREVTPVDLGGASFGADGMVLDGSRLYAVLNYGAPSGVYVARLDPELRTGQVTHSILADASGAPFDLPTTLARYQCRLYVVNSQLDDRPGTPPYTVSAVPDPTC